MQEFFENFCQNFKLSYKIWLGWKVSNPRMWESESHALPLGDTPTNLFGFENFGWGGRIRTYEMIESKSIALPLGYTPILSFKICGVEGGA